MVLPIYQSYAPSTASTTGFASNVTGGTWTLTANAAPDGYAHQITLHNDSATDHSAKTVTYVGTNPDGKAQTYTMNMPGANATVTSTYYFKTLTSATPSATIGADTMDIGYAASFAGPTTPIDWGGNVIFTSVSVTGTINYTVQYTGDNIQGQPPTYPPATPPYNWQADVGATTNATATASNTFTSSPIAMRIIVNSYSAGATIPYFTISQMARPR